MAVYVVTGGSGLIGKALLERIAGEHDVHALSRSALPEGPAHVRQVPCNLSTHWDESCLPARADVVIHLAQSRGFRQFPAQAEDIFQVNVASTFRLLEYARRAGVSRFVLASSGGVNPWKNQCDATPITAGNGYGVGFYLGSKLCGEILTENYLSLFNVSILRFYFVYGPGQRAEMLVPRLIDSVRAGRPIQLQGERGITINPTYVADAVTALLRACELPGSQKCHVGGPESLCLRQMGEIIGRAVGREPCFEIQSQLPPPALVGDSLQTQALIGGSMINFDEGVQRCLAGDGSSNRSRTAA